MTWRWPWVSRAEMDRRQSSLFTAYQVEVEAKRQQAKDAIAERDAERERYADLLAKYHELAMPKPPLFAVEAVAPVEPKEPDPIAVTIREQAAGDVGLSKHLHNYARTLRKQGKTTDEIVGALVEWQTSEPSEHVALS